MSVNAPIAGGRVSAPDPIALGPIRHAGDGRTLTVAPEAARVRSACAAGLHTGGARSHASSLRWSGVTTDHGVWPPDRPAVGDQRRHRTLHCFGSGSGPPPVIVRMVARCVETSALPAWVWPWAEDAAHGQGLADPKAVDEQQRDQGLHRQRVRARGREQRLGVLGG